MKVQFDLTVDEGKGRMNPSRDKNQGKHRRGKVEKCCVTFLLCDPGWCVHKSDVQNKWDDNTHTLSLLIVQTRRTYMLCTLQVREEKPNFKGR